MISAAKARRKSLAALNDNIRPLLKNIESQIKRAADHGLFDIHLYHYPMLPEILSILREYGYEIEALNEDYIRISWDAKNGDDDP